MVTIATSCYSIVTVIAIATSDEDNETFEYEDDVEMTLMNHSDSGYHRNK